MVSLTSLPYAPIFWTGEAPTVPGIPARFSRPHSPRCTHPSTSVSQCTPAPAVTRMKDSSSVNVMPEMRISTTTPLNPSSEARMLLPSPSTLHGRLCSHANAMVSATSDSVSHVKTYRATPPTRRVESVARETSSVLIIERRSAPSGPRPEHAFRDLLQQSRQSRFVLL